MNKKSIKKILSIFLFVAFAFSTFSIIKAKAGTKAFTLTDASISDKSASVTANVAISGENVLSKVTFKNVNDYIVYKLTFKNNDGVDYTIKGITDNNTNEYVKYEYEQYKDETIKAGATKDILVKVIYNKEVTDVDKRDAKDAVKLSFEIADPSGNTLVANTVINPKTNDGIGLYIVIAAISVIGITALVVKNRKAVKVLTMVALVVPFAAKAVESSFVIELNNELNLHDKALVTTEIDDKKVKSLVPYEQAFTKPADPVKEGYDFVGWFVGDQEYNFDTPLADDVVITAKFNKVEYTITYDPNEGKVATESVKVGKGETIAAAVPFNRQYFTFDGWFDGPDENANLVVEKNGSFTPNGNMTLYAHWSSGKEVNLVDTDNDNNVSIGDIVNFGPEKFVIIDTSSSENIKLLALNPLGDNNGIKQSTDNLISKEYTSVAYWLDTEQTQTPSGWPNSSFSYYGDLYDNIANSIDNYGDAYGVTTEAAQYNLLYPVLNEYENYLNSMSDFYHTSHLTLMTFKDAHDIGCKFNETQDDCTFMNDGYSFWIGSSVINVNTDVMKDAPLGYYDADSSSIKSVKDFSAKKYIRPVLIVTIYDIIAPWDL